MSSEHGHSNQSFDHDRGAACPARNGLSFDRLPFALAPDAEFLFWTETHLNALDVLRRGVAHGSPIILLTGEIGSGKTTLVQHFLASDLGTATTGLLSFLAVERRDFCAWLLLAFGRDASDGSAMAHFAELQAFLMAEHEAGRRCVLVVDEAQDATDDELDALRQLTNMNAGRHMLLQVVLVGQPELRARIGSAGLAPLAARIGADAHVSPMGQDETADYVRHRLTCGGGPGDAFAPEALAEIHGICRGVPRRTNLLCDLCVAEAVRRDASGVDAALVRDVAAEARRRAGYLGLFETGDGDEVGRPIMDSPGASAKPCEDIGAVPQAKAKAATGAPVSKEPGPAIGAASIGPVSPPTQPDRQVRWQAAVAAPANSASRIEPAKTIRKGSPPDTPRPQARGDEDRPRSDRASDAETAHHLAFAAMASLADYRRDGERARRSSSKQRELQPDAPGRTKDGGARPSDRDASGRTRRSSHLALLVAALSAGAAMLIILVLAVPIELPVSGAEPAPAETTSQIVSAVEPPAPAEPAPEIEAISPPPHTDEARPGRGLDPRTVLTTPALPTIAGPDMTSSELYALALDLALVDKETAAIALARAAIRGHQRAAYYLAQVYETGDGAPRNLALARAWYELSGLPRAQERVASLDVGAPSDVLAPPVLKSASRTSDGMLELVWTDATEGSRVAYNVEILDGADGSRISSETVFHSAHRIEAPDSELFWRVTSRTRGSASISTINLIPATD